jgi:hypothetical protein
VGSESRTSLRGDLEKLCHGTVEMMITKLVIVPVDPSSIVPQDAKVLDVQLQRPGDVDEICHSDGRLVAGNSANQYACEVLSVDRLQT